VRGTEGGGIEPLTTYMTLKIPGEQAIKGKEQHDGHSKEKSNRPSGEDWRGEGADKKGGGKKQEKVAGKEKGPSDGERSATGDKNHQGKPGRCRRDRGQLKHEQDENHFQGAGKGENKKEQRGNVPAQNAE